MPLRRLFVVPLLALTAGCGASNDLSGSAGELFSLDFARVEVLRSEEALSVRYFNNRAAAVDVVISLSVYVQDLELRPGRKIDLAGEYSPGHPRTTVVHAPAAEPARTFAAVRRGDLELDEGGEPGQRTQGDFSMSFEPGDAFGGGRNLEGSFVVEAAIDARFGN